MNFSLPQGTRNTWLLCIPHSFILIWYPLECLSYACCSSCSTGLTSIYFSEEARSSTTLAFSSQSKPLEYYNPQSWPWH